MKQAPEAYFSPDYLTARRRFRDAARAAGAAMDALLLEARGPGGEALSIDIARIGPPDAKRIVLHSSGMHGVEAFAGAAAQLAVLDDLPDLPSTCALVLVHVLNPYGMAWLRRANENNVDLNRNFLLDPEPFEGAPAQYAALDPLINPPSPPRADAFLARIGWFALRHGIQGPKQAIAEGQYEYPRGLFFGGRALQQGPRLYLDWLRAHLGAAAYIFAIDAHTGLGRRGAETLVLEPGAHATTAEALSRGLGKPLSDAARGQTAYRIRGSMAGALPRALPHARLDFVLQEIGTQPTLGILHALREENRLHHFGSPADLQHRAKRALLEAHCPASSEWRRRAAGLGLALVRAAARYAFGRADEP